MPDLLNTSVPMRVCPSCGTRLRGDARFCGNCGLKLPQHGQLDARSLVGEVVANAYRVESILGTGSMGVVYRAEQIALNRPVALKVIGESTDDETTRARFRREARASSQLRHPNVVQIHDFGQLPGGQPYLAMELLEGKTLEQIIEEEFPIAFERVVSFMTDILSALQAAHDKGILHRDLKPANVFISTLPDRREIAKVLDFGIATAMDGTQSGSKTWAPLTEAGFVCGTPAFMSPEQVQGLPLDQRSDLFSAAGLMYQMLTRERPFPGKTPVEVGANIVLKPLLPPSKIQPGLPLQDEIDRFFQKAMAKRAEERFETAVDMMEAIKRLHDAIVAAANAPPASTPAAMKAVKPKRSRGVGQSGVDTRSAAHPARGGAREEREDSLLGATQQDELEFVETAVQPKTTPAGLVRAQDRAPKGSLPHGVEWKPIEITSPMKEIDATSTQRVRQQDIAPRRMLSILVWVLVALATVGAGVLAVFLIRR